MSKATDTAVNIGTDNAFLSSAGNAVLKFKSAGMADVGLGLASMIVCGALRAQAEHRKDMPVTEATGRWGRALRDPRAGLAFNAVTQLAVAGTIAAHGGVPHDLHQAARTAEEMAVPFLFAVGNAVAAKSVVKALFSRAANATTSVVKTVKGKARAVTDYVIGRPYIYWTTGMILAGGSPISTAFFTTAFATEAAQAVLQADMPEGPPRTPLQHFARANYMPAVLNAGGCLAACALYAIGRNPFGAAAMGIFAGAYLSYVVESTRGSVAEFFHARRPSYENDAASGPTAHA